MSWASVFGAILSVVAATLITSARAWTSRSTALCAGPPLADMMASTAAGAFVVMAVAWAVVSLFAATAAWTFVATSARTALLTVAGLPLFAVIRSSMLWPALKPVWSWDFVRPLCLTTSAYRPRRTALRADRGAFVAADDGEDEA